jgi:hypothetical protein
MAKNSDPRFSPSRFSGAPAPLRVSRAAGDGGLAQRKALHAESERRNQYTAKSRPRVERERTARE